MSAASNGGSLPQTVGTLAVWTMYETDADITTIYVPSLDANGRLYVREIRVGGSLPQTVGTLAVCTMYETDADITTIYVPSLDANGRLYVREIVVRGDSVLSLGRKGNERT